MLTSKYTELRQVLAQVMKSQLLLVHFLNEKNYCFIIDMCFTVCFCVILQIKIRQKSVV